ncbi:carboxypeptidase-like regulatory domain-containing protein [Clostridium sp. LP20]|uniref:carboxypeptidase-like regulatory domain-containing protein n=1 Tax=Clostridium sp. LP20 TaxID=3418665 RepID=UPI003EE5EC8A
MRKNKKSIKLGNLFLFLVTIFLFIPGLLYIVGSTMRKMDGEFLGKSKRYYGTASMELFTKIPKLIPTTGKVYYDIGTGYYNVIEDKGFYSNYGHTSGNLGNVNRVNKSIDNFRNGLLLGEEDKFYGENLSMLINTLVALGNKDEAIKYIEAAKTSKNERIKDVGLINEIIFMAKDGKGKEAIELCKENIDKKDFEILYMNLMYNYGSDEEFNEELVIRVEKVKEELSKDTLRETNPTPYDRQDHDIFIYKDVDLLKYVDFRCYTNFPEREDWSNVVEGRLTKNGEGVPYQKITIGTANEYTYNKRGNILDTAVSRSVYTNGDGYYSYEGVKDGRYSYEVSFDGYLIDRAYVYPKNIAKEDQLEGIKVDKNIVKVDFGILDYFEVDDTNTIEEDKDWITINLPEIARAKSVSICFFEGGSMCSLDSKIDEKFNVKIPLDNGSFLMRNFSGNEKYNSEGNEYIGNIEEKELDISMIFYDENNYIIAKTTLDKLKYTTKEKQLNNGDKLMLEGKYDEAVKWYKSKIEEEGVSRKFLYPIIKYYGDYTRRNTEEFNKYYDKLNEIELEDIEKNFLEGWGRS